MGGYSSPWSDEHTTVLRTMLSDGRGYKAIGKVVGRHGDAVRKKAIKLGLCAPPPDRYPVELSDRDNRDKCIAANDRFLQAMELALSQGEISQHYRYRTNTRYTDRNNGR